MLIYIYIYYNLGKHCIPYNMIKECGAAAFTAIYRQYTTQVPVIWEPSYYATYLPLFPHMGVAAFLILARLPPFPLRLGDLLLTSVIAIPEIGPWGLTALTILPFICTTINNTVDQIKSKSGENAIVTIRVKQHLSTHTREEVGEDGT